MVAASDPRARTGAARANELARHHETHQSGLAVSHTRAHFNKTHYMNPRDPFPYSRIVLCDSAKDLGPRVHYFVDEAQQNNKCSGLGRRVLVPFSSCVPDAEGAGHCGEVWRWPPKGSFLPILSSPRVLKPKGGRPGRSIDLDTSALIKPSTRKSYPQKLWPRIARSTARQVASRRGGTLSCFLAKAC